MCELVLGLGTHECSTGQQPPSVGARLYGLSFDCFFLSFLALFKHASTLLFFSLATAGSDVSIRGGLTRGLYAWAFYHDYDDRGGRINLLVWVMVCADVVAESMQIIYMKSEKEKSLRSLYIVLFLAVTIGVYLKKRFVTMSARSIVVITLCLCALYILILCFYLLVTCHLLHSLPCCL